MLKQCTKCGETKAFEFFYKAQTNKDGLTSMCKLCRKVYVFRPRRKTNAERIAANKYRSKLTPGVYFIKANNGTYIGQSKVIEIRICNHKPWNKDSPVDKIISYKILEVVKDETIRLEREAYWINKLSPSLNIQLLS